MAIWYRTGTVSVTNGSTNVTGAGTDFIGNVRIGDGFVGPDGKLYEIAGINSATSLTLASVYTGASASNQVYAIVPTQGLTKDLASRVVNLINSYQTVRDGIGAGLLPEGTALTPALRFASDADTGLYLSGTNALSLSAGGVPCVTINAAATDSVRTTIRAGDPQINRGLAITTPGVANGERSVIEYYATFNTAGHADKLPRRVADISAGFASGWGSQYLAFHVGQAVNDAKAPTPERMRLTAEGRCLLGGESVAGVSGYAPPGLSVQRQDDASVELVTRHDGGFSPFLFFTKQNTNGGAIAAGSAIGSVSFCTPGGDGVNRVLSYITTYCPVGPAADDVVPEGYMQFGLRNTSGGVAYVLRLQNKYGAAPTATFDANVIPSADNARSLGTADKRWTVVYSTTGAINTSDARLKTPVRAMTDAEIAAAKALADEIGIYQWLDAIATKGADKARLHVGVTVQRVIEIMQQHDLDPMRYAFVCYDAHPERVRYESEEVEVEVQEQTGVDPSGNPVVETVKRIETRTREVVEPASDVYSLRHDQLLLFIGRGMAERTQRIEERLAALEAAR